MLKRLLIPIILSGLLVSVAWPGESKQPVVDEPQKTTPVSQPLSPQADQIPWSSVNAGGALNMSSTNYRVGGTAGQSSIGYGTSTNYLAGFGFWYGAKSGAPVCLAKPGDANASGTYTLGDVISIVNYIFNKPGCSPQPLCWISSLLCRGDWNGSGTVSLSDVIRAVNYIFNKPGGPWNALPVGVCCL